MKIVASGFFYVKYFVYISSIILIIKTKTMEKSQEITRAQAMVKESAIEFIDSLLSGVSTDNFELWDDLVELMDMVEQGEMAPSDAVTRASFLFRNNN